MGEYEVRARICKPLRSPGIDSKESLAPHFVAWRNRFLIIGAGILEQSIRTDSGIGLSYRPVRLRVFTKFRILEISYISYVFFKFGILFESGNNFAKIFEISFLQIYQLSIAKFMTFFLDTSVNVV